MPQNIHSNSLVAKVLLILAAMAAFPFTASATVQSGEIRADLPENGRLRIINRRGSVQIEAWSEPFVSVTVGTGLGQTPRSPVKVQRSIESLQIQVAQPARNQKSVTAVDLIVKTPERAKVSIVTGAGEVRVNGVPRELNVLT